MANPFGNMIKRIGANLAAAFAPEEEVQAQAERTSYGRAIMTGSVPGYWTSDHYRETLNYKGWTYIAVHTAAKLAASATRTIFFADNVKTPNIARKALAPEVHTKPETADHDHYLNELLDNPNPMFSGDVFIYQIVQQMRLTGTALVWEVKNFSGTTPVQLWVIPQAWCRYQPPCPDFDYGYYRVQPIAPSSTTQYFALPSMAGFNIDYREVARIGWPSPLYPGEGTSSLSACGMMIDISDEQDTATYAGFQNAPKPTLHVNIAETVDFDDIKRTKLREELLSRNAGSVNAGRPLITQGADVQPMGANPADLDYINGRNQSRDNIFGIQQITPMAAGVSEATAYSAAIASLKQTSELSIQPDLDRIGGALTHRWRKLYPGLRISYDAKNYDDPVITLSYTQAKVASKCFTVNEIRALYGAKPIDGGDEPPELIAQQQQQKQAAEQQMMAGLAMPGANPDPFAAPKEDPLQEHEKDSSGEEKPKLGDADQFTDQSSGPKITGIKKPEETAAAGNRMRGFGGKN